MRRTLGLALAGATLTAAQTSLSFSYPYAAGLGCFPNAANAFGTVSRPVLAKGDTAYVCLNINGAVTSLYNIVADQFSAISVMGLNYASPPGAGYIQQGVGWVPSISAANNNSLTFYTVFDMASYGVYTDFPRVYKQMNYAPSVSNPAVLGVASIQTFPIWTLIIQAERGVIQNLVWDEGCIFCAENGPECLATSFNASSSSVADFSSVFRQCSSDMATCYPPSEGGSLVGNSTGGNSTAYNGTLPDGGCDLKVFITWTGTDRNGQYFTSANKRFSRYRAFAVATAWQSAINLANSGMDLANKVSQTVQAIPNQIIPAANNERRLRRSLKGGAAGAYSAALEEGLQGPQLPETDTVRVPPARMPPGVAEYARAGGRWPEGTLEALREARRLWWEQRAAAHAAGKGATPPQLDATLPLAAEAPSGA